MTEPRSVEIFLKETKGIPAQQTAGAMTDIVRTINFLPSQSYSLTKRDLAESWRKNEHGKFKETSIEDILRAVIRRYPNTWLRKNKLLQTIAKENCK